MKELKDLQDGHIERLRGCEGARDRVHVYDKKALLAMQAALAARRPLLVRGEPGTGKSQLALAAATSLGRPLLSYVVNSRTTAQELLWSFDAVARLAEAQLAGALQRLARSSYQDSPGAGHEAHEALTPGSRSELAQAGQAVARAGEGTARVGEGTARVGEGTARVGEGTARVGEGTARVGEAKPASSRAAQLLRQQQSIEDVRHLLDERRFVTPGPLWWALHWQSAKAHAEDYHCPLPDEPPGWDEAQGTVVLIDEIDKADSDVPNGLLEVLGIGRFRPQGYAQSFQICGAAQPLILITTNEERALPDAFVRRCMVLNIQLPSSEQELEAFLVKRGAAHFQGKRGASTANQADDAALEADDAALEADSAALEADDAVLEAAAKQLVKDRSDLKARNLPPPGQAEYLDLVRAVITLRKGKEEQLQLLKELSGYAFQKHPEGLP